MKITTNTTRKQHAPLAGAVALAIALAAGSSAVIAAGPEHKGDKHTQRAHDATAYLTLVRSDALIGSDVMGTNSTKIGTVKDMVIDRGTGRVVFAIIGHGGILTIGQDVFASEYSRLGYSSADGHFTIDMTEEQAERQVEFLPEDWNDLAHSDWMSDFTESIMGEDTERYGDAKLAMGETTEIKGLVSKVARTEDGEYEDVVLTIEDQQGESRKVVLGPSWYIMGMDNTPATGDRVELTTVRHDGRLIATNARVGSQELKLRDRNGHASWKMQSRETPRYVLLSDLTGRQIEIGGTTAGEVQNTIVETSSGRVAFFGFDSNDNLFGLGDEITMVPWSTLQISPDLTIWSESSSETFAGAMAMPDDLSTLRTKRSITNAFTPFDMRVPNFEANTQAMDRDHSISNHLRYGDAWSKDSKLTKTFAEGNKVKLNGEFLRTESVELGNGGTSATALWLNTADGRQQVILGPNWFVEHQDLKMNRGDTVSIVGRKATIDGKEYIAAWDIEHETSTWTLWDDTTPAWVDER